MSCSDARMGSATVNGRTNVNVRLAEAPDYSARELHARVTQITEARIERGVSAVNVTY